ncbi:MAG: ATP-grasp domain-containing protein [Bacillota bacterium]
MPAIKVWFNRWFSTAYNIIDLLRNNQDGTRFHFIVSHPNRYSTSLQNADIAFIEPDLSDEEYIDYCLNFCRENKIDVLIPNHKSSLIAEYVDMFNKFGTKVLVWKNTELLRLINDKVSFYDHIKPKNILRIPDYYNVTTKEEFMKAYDKIKTKGKVCFKPTNGVGGVGFRVINESPYTIEDILNSSPSHSVNLKQLLDLLPEQGSFKNIMLMEYLDGYEYSIDCLADENGNLIMAIPRKKIDKYNRYLEHNAELLKIAQEISYHYKIPYIYNIQVKYKNGEPNLLEVNTRMSGGIHYSCMSGINLPYEALKILLNKKIYPSAVKLDIMVGNVDRTIQNICIG